MAETQTRETSKIVRLMRKDIPGDVNLERALQQLRGISFMMAHAIRLRSGLPKNTRMGDLNEAQMLALTKILENLNKQNFPTWLYNRRKDYATGTDFHKIEAELEFAEREDVQRMKRMKTYKGVRHIFGLRVRGQRTRTTGRKGTILGVMRAKKGAPAAAPPSAQKGPAGKPPAAKKEAKK